MQLFLYGSKNLSPCGLNKSQVCFSLGGREGKQDAFVCVCMCVFVGGGYQGWGTGGCGRFIVG